MIWRSGSARVIALVLAIGPPAAVVPTAAQAPLSENGQWVVLRTPVGYGRVQQEPPPAYPRPGATLMLENDRVLVWNITWLQQEYPQHRHRYDHVGVYYRPGDRVITSTEGTRRDVHTDAWNISFQRRGVTHTEQGASAEPLRAVFIQIKQEPRDPIGASGSVATFPSDGPEQRLDNDRATVWQYVTGGAAGGRARHRHAHDAVVVSFDATLGPQVRFLERGTEHDSDVPERATRTLVFEIK